MLARRVRDSIVIIIGGGASSDFYIIVAILNRGGLRNTVIIGISKDITPGGIVIIPASNMQGNAS